MLRLRLVCLSVVLMGLVSVVAPARAATPAYSTGFTRWRAADKGFAGWHRSGTSLRSDGVLQLDPESAAVGTDPYVSGGYYGGNFYNGDSFLVGEATSPVQSPGFGFFEAIASWNADTPGGTWVETQIRAQVSNRWTKWYNLGIWTSGVGGATQRHSVRLQGDADGTVATDTLVLSSKKAAATAYQLKLRLFRSAGSTAQPSVRGASVAVSTKAIKPKALEPGDRSRWGRVIDVPQCSQMVYPGGGEVWCSPTSISMVLGYWGAAGPCAPRVEAAVKGVYDFVYDGHGNWPFNTAYAATHGMEGYVARFTSMAQAERWIAAGVPVIVSYAWSKSTLTGAPISSSNGHLAVLVGFEADGDPIINDPAAASDSTVRRAYNRAQFESLWLEHSGGTVYLVYPSGRSVPNL